MACGQIILSSVTLLLLRPHPTLHQFKRAVLTLAPSFACPPRRPDPNCPLRSGAEVCSGFAVLGPTQNPGKTGGGNGEGKGND